MKNVIIQTSYDIDTINDMEINVNDLINELNEISKKVKVLSINDDGEANVEFASKKSLKEFLIEVQSQEGGPSINEDEIDDYINEILN
jgi:hypothetical protein